MRVERLLKRFGELGGYCRARFKMKKKTMTGICTGGGGGGGGGGGFRGQI